jgi:hypothetical protein
MSIKYPNIKVRLVGEDGNAFSILGRTTRAMRMGGVSQEQIDAFRAEATAGDYNHLLCTVMSWVATDDEYEDKYDDDFFAELDAEMEENI